MMDRKHFSALLSRAATAYLATAFSSILTLHAFLIKASTLMKACSMQKKISKLNT